MLYLGVLPRIPAKGSPDSPTTSPAELPCRLSTDEYTRGPTFPTERVCQSGVTSAYDGYGRPPPKKGLSTSGLQTSIPILWLSSAAFYADCGPHQLAGQRTHQSERDTRYNEAVQAEHDAQLGDCAASALIAKSIFAAITQTVHPSTYANEPWRCYCSKGALSARVKNEYINQKGYLPLREWKILILEGAISHVKICQIVDTTTKGESATQAPVNVERRRIVKPII